MALSRQARILSPKQIELALHFLSCSRHAARNQLIFLLSAKAGLRAKEIASLQWEMVCTPEGEVSDQILLYDKASKGKSGRCIPMHGEVRSLLVLLRDHKYGFIPTDYIIETERAKRTSAQAIVNMFWGWYGMLNLNGCSSHSGRRTFITNAARKISTVGGSVRDVQMLAGHANMRTTQGYIEAEPQAQIKVVALLCKRRSNNPSLKRPDNLVAPE